MKWLNFLLVILIFFAGISTTYAKKYKISILVESQLNSGLTFGVGSGVNAYIAETKHLKIETKEIILNKLFSESGTTDFQSKIDFTLEEGKYILIIHGEGYIYDRSLIEVKPAEEGAEGEGAVVRPSGPDNSLLPPPFLVVKRIKILESAIHIPGSWGPGTDSPPIFNPGMSDLQTIKELRDYFNNNPTVLKSPQSTNYELDYYQKQDLPYKKEIIQLRSLLFEGKTKQAKELKDLLEKEYGALLDNDVFFPVYKQYLQVKQ